MNAGDSSAPLLYVGRMRVRGLTGSLVLACMLNIATAEAASSIAGSSCKTKNAVRTSLGTRFVCTALAGRLVWKRAATAPQPVPSPSATVGPSIDITLATLDQHRDEAVQRIWREAARFRELPAPVGIQRRIAIGPYTSTWGVDPGPVFDYADRFFSFTSIPTHYSIYYYRYADVGWAQRTFASTYGDVVDAGMLTGCGNMKCEGGNALRVDGTWLHANIGSELPRTSKSFPTFLEFHEYTHLVQYAQRDPGSKEPEQTVPRWLIEGQANFFGALLSSDSLDAYRNNRRSSWNRFWTPEESWILDWLGGTDANSDKTDKSWDYQLGHYATESLAAVYGVPSTLEVIRRTKNGAVFKDAFKETFHEDWDTVLPVLAHDVYVMYKFKSN